MPALTRAITLSKRLAPLATVGGKCNGIRNGLLSVAQHLADLWHEARTRRTYDDPTFIRERLMLWDSTLTATRKPYTPKP